MNVKLDKINQKIIGQVRFRPSLESFSSAPVIARILEKKFEEWQADGDNITLYSPEQSKLTQIFFDKLTYRFNISNLTENIINEISEWEKVGTLDGLMHISKIKDLLLEYQVIITKRVRAECFFH